MNTQPISIAKRRLGVFDEWLLRAIGYLDYLDYRVFRDRCTRGVAESIIKSVAEYYKDSKHRPDFRLIVKYAVLIASRECSECIDYDKLLKHSPRISSSILSKYDYLKKFYKPLDLHSYTKACIKRVVDCLVERGFMEATEREKLAVSTIELVDRLWSSKPTYAGKPLVLAGLCVYMAAEKQGLGIDLTAISSCIDRSVEDLRQLLRALRRRIQTYY